MTVAGVVVAHGPDPDLPACLEALAPQVDELVLIANIPGPPEAVPQRARVIQNRRPQGFAANANLGVAQTKAPFVVIANPDAVAEPGAIRTLLNHMENHPRCGIAGPELRFPDGRWQSSRRRFPTVRGTLVRRTPLRLLLPPDRFSRAHYLLDERPSEPVQSDWMLGGFLLLRRTMLDELGGFDEGFRLYGEDIDLCYRASQAGWERWYVPAAQVRHRLGELTLHRFFTRRTIWHWRGIFRFVKKHPETLKAFW